MAGIRVKGIPGKIEERHLKIHFSKPEHGGGKILKIYFPLFNNDAVIIFSDKKVSSKVVKYEQKLSSHVLDVEILPEHMVFSSVSAKLDAEASVLVQVTQSLRDEMEFAEGLKVEFDQDEACVLQGNWFQLEWAWYYIDCFMRQQKIIQHEISRQPHQRYAGTPMEVDESEDLSRHQSDSPFDSADLWPQGHQKDKSDRNRSKKKTDLRTFSVDDEIPTLSHRENHTKYGRDSSPLVSSPEREEYDDKDRRSNPSSRSALDDMGALKKKIGRSYKREQRNRSPRHRNEYDHSDDSDVSLHGSGFNVPLDSMSTVGQQKLDRSADENSTFRKFSGFDSVRTPSPVGHQAESMHEPSINRSPRSRKPKSPPVSPGFNLSNDKSPSTSLSARKPSVDSIDQSLGLAKAGISVQLMQVPDKYTADQLRQTFSINGLSVTVYFGNLVKETTDAIVNAANNELEFYGGIAYAIQQARGPELKQECQRYMMKNGKLKTTEVMHTSGGGSIKSTHIIHAAGPMWLSRDERRIEENAYKLMKTFLSCLEYADERLWIKSLALPAISSGVYGAPLDICVRCFLDAVLIFTDEHVNDRRLADVRLVNNDAESTVTSIVLIQTILEQGTGTLTTSALQLKEKYAAKRDRRLHLPRGRPETSDFSSSFMQSSSLGVGYGMDSSSGNDAKTSSSANRRRSSSLDTRPKKKSTDSTTKVYDTSSGTFVPDNKHAESTAGSSIVDKHRSRTGSFSSDAKKSPRTSLSSTIGGTSGRTTETHGSKASSRYGSTADKISKTTGTPRIKESLFNSSRLGNLKKSSPKKTDSSLYHTTDNYGASRSGLKKAMTNTTSDEEDQEYGMQSLPADLHTRTSLKQQSSYRDKFLNASSSNTETCAICLDDVKNPKQLAKCKHKFCTPCIERHFRTSKPTCPTCGAMYGRITGSQPRNGRMTHTTDRSRLLPGYESEDGMIVITYTFPDGVQESCHPDPGKPYKGLQRKAFLPNSVEGREVLRMLKRAFDARLVFTIGDSKTRGESGLLTWNDIHHKTSLRGGPTKFGYPDPDYLRRVKEELAAVGITSG